MDGLTGIRSVEVINNLMEQDDTRNFSSTLKTGDVKIQKQVSYTTEAGIVTCYKSRTLSLHSFRV